MIVVKICLIVLILLGAMLAILDLLEGKSNVYEFIFVEVVFLAILGVCII